MALSRVAGVCLAALGVAVALTVVANGDIADRPGRAVRERGPRELRAEPRPQNRPDGGERA